MWLVIMCDWSHDFESEIKVQSEAHKLGYCEHYWQVAKVISQKLQEYAPLDVKWEYKTESVHQTVVYGGIGFFLAVKVKES